MLVLRLHPDSIAALGPHRTQPAWEACIAEDALWLRCPEADAARTAALPCTVRFRTNDAGDLVPATGRIAVRRAPHGRWSALVDFLTPQPPRPLLPATVPGGFAVRLVPSSAEAVAAALLAPLAALTAWAEDAPRVRRDRLAFAATPDGTAIVRGTPLPAVPGTPLHRRGALLLPCGFDLPAGIATSWVEASLTLPAGALVLVAPDGRWHRVDAEAFVPFSLAALRRTARTLTSAS